MTLICCLAETLHRKWQEAVKRRDEERAYIMGLEQDIDEEQIQEWRQRLDAFYIGVENIRNHKTLDNPFIPNVDRGGCIPVI